MTATTTNFALPYPTALDRPCDFASQWCDFTDALQTVIDGFQTVIDRTNPVIPIARMMVTTPVDVASNGEIPFDTLSVDTADLVEGLNPDAVLVLGDVAYEQVTPESIKAYDASWGRFLDRTHAVVGNHEYFGNGPEVYWDYFGDRAGDRGSGWYSFDVGAWHVVVLNSECSDVDCDPDGDQLEWLKADLDGNSARCTLAAFHRPRFSSGDEYGDDESVSGFWQVLQDAGADVVLNGHEHSYERFAPQRDSGRATAEEGMAEFVVGTGGRDLRGFGEPTPNSEVRWNDSFGVLALTLHPDRYDWRFHATDGADVDEGSAADEAGIAAGDIIEQVGGKSVATAAALRTALREQKATRKHAALLVYRDGRAQFVPLRLSDQ